MDELMRVGCKVFRRTEKNGLLKAGEVVDVKGDRVWIAWYNADGEVHHKADFREERMKRNVFTGDLEPVLVLK